MLIDLIFKKDSKDKFDKIFVTHIKLSDDKGKYIKFLRHSDELLDFLKGVSIHVSNDFAKENLM